LSDSLHPPNFEVATLATLAELQINVNTDALDRADRKMRRMARTSSRAASSTSNFGAVSTKVSRESAKLADAQASVSKAAKSTAASTNQASSAFGRFKRSLPIRFITSITDAMKKMSIRARLLIGSIGALIGIVGALRQEMVALAAVAGSVLVDVQLEPVQRRLQQITDSTQEFRKQMGLLRDIANETGVRLTAIGPAAADITTAVQAAGGSMAKARAIADGFTQGLRNLGLGTEDIVGKLEEVAELAKQDTVTLGDLRGLVENTVNPTQTLADALGMTSEKLRRMDDSAVATGQALAAVGQQMQEQTESAERLSGAFARFLNTLTTQLEDVLNRNNVVIDAIIRQFNNLTNYLESQEFENVLGNLQKGLTQFISVTLPNAIQSIKAHWNEIVKTVEVAVGMMVGFMIGGGPGALVGGMLAAVDAIGPIVDQIGSLMKGLIQNFEAVGRTLEAVAGILISVFVGRGLSSMLPALARAGAATATFASTVGRTGAAITGFTALFGPLTAATHSYGIAAQQAGVRLTGFGGAVGRARKVIQPFMRAIGGVPGLIMSAVGVIGSLVVGFGNYESAATRAQDATRDFAMRIADLNDTMRETTQAGAQAALMNLRLSMQETQDKIRGTKEELRDLISEQRSQELSSNPFEALSAGIENITGGGDIAKIAELRSEIERLEEAQEVSGSKAAELEKLLVRFEEQAKKSDGTLEEFNTNLIEQGQNVTKVWEGVENQFRKLSEQKIIDVSQFEDANKRLDAILENMARIDKMQERGLLTSREARQFRQKQLGQAPDTGGDDTSNDSSKLGKIANVAGAASQELGQLFQVIKGIASGNWAQAVAAAIQVMAESSKAFRNVLDTLNKYVGRIIKVFGDLVADILGPTLRAVEPLVDAFAELGRVLRPFAQLVGQLLAGFGLFRKVFEAVGKVIQWVVDILEGILSIFGMDLSDSSQRMADTAERQKELASEWNSVLDQSQDLIDRLRFGTSSPASARVRGQKVQAEISRQRQIFESASGEERVAAAERLNELIGRRLDIAEKTQQRPGGQFAETRNDLLSLLQEVRGVAQPRAQETPEGAPGGAGGISGPDISGFLGNVWDGIVGAAESAWNTITSVAKSAWNTITSFATSVWDGIVGAAQSAWDSIKNMAMGVFDGLANVVSQLGGGAVDLVKQGGEWLVKTGGKVLDAAGDAVDSVKDTVSDIASSIGDALGLAKGGVISNGIVQQYADGGLVNQPTVFPMANGMGLMGEAGPEAIMPLTRTSGGDLGVKMEGSGSTINAPIEININGDGMDSDQIAEEVDRRLQESMSQIAKDLKLA
jgi:phage-related protein